jgi:hypothetical protein
MVVGAIPFVDWVFRLVRARGATTTESPVAAEPSRSELTFLIFGDWGRGGEFHQRGAGSKVREPGPTEGSRFYRGTPGFMGVTLTAKENQYPP